MSDIVDFSLEEDFSVMPCSGGGFIVSQYRDGDGGRGHYKKAFSTINELSAFLQRMASAEADRCRIALGEERLQWKTAFVNEGSSDG